MNGFLTFLSNNYLYFLIAAGVLFFALIGFLVDLKRKKNDSDSNGVVDETPIPDVVSIDESNPLNETVEEETNANEFNMDNSLETPVNPAPPMPNEPIDMAYSANDVNNEPTNNINSVEVIDTQETVINTTPETFETNQTDNQDQTLEEFK